MNGKDAAIQTVLRRILVLNLLVAAAKLTVGFATGAISMIADGFSSLIDGLSNLVAIVAQWIAASPPDEQHPYGHRRFEAIATFIIGGFLLLAAWEVLQAAVERLIEGGAPEVQPMSFIVMLVTLAINVFVVLYERNRGHALNSQILIADSSHTLTDVFVSLSVLAGLGLVSFGILWADAALALLIVVVIARMGWHIIAESVEVLVDAAPLSAEALSEVVRHMPQVQAVSDVRSRGTGDDIRVDMQVAVAREITAEHTNHLRGAITDAVQEQFPTVSEVQVSFAPQMDAAPDYMLLVRAAADGLGLNVHEVIPIEEEDGLTLEMHVEVKPGLTLTAAHEQVTALESKLIDSKTIHNVITHIEPENKHGAPITQTHLAIRLREQALEIARELYPTADWHDGTIRLALGGYALTVHVHLPGTMSVEEAHQIAEEVETRIRAKVAEIQRVTIHTEPIESE